MHARRMVIRSDTPATDGGEVPADAPLPACSADSPLSLTQCVEPDR